MHGQVGLVGDGWAPQPVHGRRPTVPPPVAEVIRPPSCNGSRESSLLLRAARLLEAVPQQARDAHLRRGRSRQVSARYCTCHELYVPAAPRRELGLWPNRVGPSAAVGSRVQRHDSNQMAPPSRGNGAARGQARHSPVEQRKRRASASQQAAPPGGCGDGASGPSSSDGGGDGTEGGLAGSRG